MESLRIIRQASVNHPSGLTDLLGACVVAASVAHDDQGVALRVFPKRRIGHSDAKTRGVLPTHELLQATKAASVFARDNSMIVRIQLTPPEEDQELALGKVVVSANSAEMGDNTGELDATVTGEEQQVAFNGKYLREALEALHAPQVRLDVNGPASPGVFRPSGPDVADGYLHVIMPMHVAK